MTSAVPSSRFRLLDAFRGIAALWVFTFHYPFSDTVANAHPIALAVFRQGHLGVPLFFVISGYCLMAALVVARRNHESTATFLYRRFLRVYPPFWCSVAVVALVPFAMESISALKTGIFVQPSAAASPNLGYLNYSPGDWFRLLSLVQVFSHVPAADSLQFKFSTINAVYWTLAIELQFYLVMALALALGAWRNVVVLFVTMLSVAPSPLSADRLSGFFLPFWPMFATGVGLFVIIDRGYTLQRIAGIRWSVTAGGLAAATLLGSAIWWSTSMGVIGEIGVAITFAAILWCLFEFDARYSEDLKRQGIRSRLTTRLVSVLGLMSYSLYLVHGRVQFLSGQLVRQVLPRGVPSDITVIALTCAFAYLFYRACERPFIGRGPRTRTS